jgi:hypothetical protein
VLAAPSGKTRYVTNSLQNIAFSQAPLAGPTTAVGILFLLIFLLILS